MLVLNIIHDTSQRLKVDFIQDCCNLYRDYCNRIVQQGRAIWLSFEYSKEMWKFIVKEQIRGGMVEIYGKLVRGKGVILAKLT